MLAHICVGFVPIGGMSFCMNATQTIGWSMVHLKMILFPEGQNPSCTSLHFSLCCLPWRLNLLRIQKESNRELTDSQTQVSSSTTLALTRSHLSSHPIWVEYILYGHMIQHPKFKKCKTGWISHLIAMLVRRICLSTKKHPDLSNSVTTK